MTQPMTATARAVKSTLIVRSNVPEVDEYREYRPYLRRDFFHSCAYCTMSEAEAQAIRFTIDHYEPRNARPDLVKAYSNLMYACDECNLRKGDRSPPELARDAGIRFFRPDEDEYTDHFELSGLLLKSRTSAAEYTIDALDLNRAGLRRLRELRTRLAECQEAVMQGVHALRNMHVDRLPPKIKGQIARSIANAQSVAEKMAAEIDDLLRSFAKSDLIDNDPESEQRAKDRAVRLNSLKVIHPGSWQAPRASQDKRR